MLAQAYACSSLCLLKLMLGMKLVPGYENLAEHIHNSIVKEISYNVTIVRMLNMPLKYGQQWNILCFGLCFCLSSYSSF